jgi:hypothetical protein
MLIFQFLRFLWVAMKFTPLITFSFLHCCLNYVTGDVIRTLYSSCSLVDVAVMGLDEACRTFLRVLEVTSMILSWYALPSMKDLFRVPDMEECPLKLTKESWILRVKNLPHYFLWRAWVYEVKSHVLGCIPALLSVLEVIS